jgi:ABC-2 type transport system ATP-binding protein
VGRRIRDLLREEANKGRAVLLNSHLLSEIELTCDRVAMLRQGKVAVEGRVADLTASQNPGFTHYKMIVSPVSDELLTSFRDTGALVERVNGHLQLATRDLEHLNTLVDRARAQGASLQELSPLRSSLEDVFVTS